MSQEIPTGVEPLLPALLEVAREMNSEKDLDRLLDATIPRVVCELLAAERCTLFLSDEQTGELWSRVATGTEREIRLASGEGIAGHVARTGETEHVSDAYSDPRFARWMDEVTGFRTRCLLCVPLRNYTGQLIGVLEVLNKKNGDFTRRDRELLELFGRQAAVAITGARTNRALVGAQTQLKEQVRRVEILYRIEKEINDSEDFEQILSSVIRLSAEAMNSAAGSILLVEGEEARLYFQYAYGEKAEDIRRLSISRDEGIAGWVLAERKPTISNEPESDKRHSARVSAQLDYRVHNLIAAPLVSDDNVIGVLEVVNRRDRGFDAGDLELLEHLASQVSGTIERKQLVEESRQAQRLATVGSMAGRIIHDLKNSMSVIRGLAEMMDRKDVPAEKVQYRKSLMLSAIDSLVAMTQDILDFTRGDIQYTFEDVDIGDVFSEVLPLLERDCEIRHVKLDVQVPQGLVLVGDRTKLKRIFFNLAINALDVMPGGGTLSVRAERDGDKWLSIDVSDTGPGIAQSVMSRLFKPFVTHGKKYGTGLGLAICKSLVEGHKGHIGARNRTNGGATFSVWLPVSQEG